MNLEVTLACWHSLKPSHHSFSFWGGGSIKEISFAGRSRSLFGWNPGHSHLLWMLPNAELDNFISLKSYGRAWRKEDSLVAVLHCGEGETIALILVVEPWRVRVKVTKSGGVQGFPTCSPFSMLRNQTGSPYAGTNTRVLLTQMQWGNV